MADVVAAAEGAAPSVRRGPGVQIPHTNIVVDQFHHASGTLPHAVYFLTHMHAGSALLACFVSHRGAHRVPTHCRSHLWLVSIMGPRHHLLFASVTGTIVAQVWHCT